MGFLKMKELIFFDWFHGYVMIYDTVDVFWKYVLSLYYYCNY